MLGAVKESILKWGLQSWTVLRLLEAVCFGSSVRKSMGTANTAAVMLVRIKIA